MISSVSASHINNNPTDSSCDLGQRISVRALQVCEGRSFWNNTSQCSTNKHESGASCQDGREEPGSDGTPGEEKTTVHQRSVV